MTKVKFQKKKYQQPIGYEWTQKESFASVFQKKKKKKKRGGHPPPPFERKTITYIGALKAKITHNFGGKNQQSFGKDGLRINHKHPFLYARLQTGRIMVWWCLSVRLRPSVRLSVRPSVRPGLRPPVFHTVLQHALTYWAEILHMTLVYCTTDQVRVSSISVKFCASYAPFGTYNTGNTQFSALFSNMLWHIELKFCIWLWFTVLQIKFECRHFASIFVGVMPLLELTILEIHSFPHFSLTCFDILSSNFAHDFAILYYWSSSSVVNLL